MSIRKFPTSNRKRVDDYYGVHDTGMGTQPPPVPPAPRPVAPPQAGPAAVPPAGSAAPLGPTVPPTGRVLPPTPAPATPVTDAPATGEPVTAHLVEDPEPPAPQDVPRAKPDPLTDPLTSETFQGVQPEPDTFASSMIGDFGYSADGGARAPSDTFSSYDQFAPPKFEPRAENTWTAPEPEPEPITVADAPDSHPDGYLDVEVVDVVEVVEEQHQPPVRETLAIDAFPYTQIDESYVDPATLPEPKEPGDVTDFNESLKEAMTIEGALGVALVDAQSGMTLATAGDPAGFNLEVAAAGNSALVQAMGRTLGDLELDDHIEDILITLGSQYQIVRPIRRGVDNLFLYLVLDRARANLAMARFRLAKLEEQIEV